MTELKKIELTEEALDQISGGKITAKKIAIVGAAIMLLAIGGTGGYVLCKHKKDKKSTSENNQGTELQDLSKKEANIPNLSNPDNSAYSPDSYRYDNDFDPWNP